MLNPGKADTLGTSRHPGTLAYLGSHQSFAEENQIVYHIDGVLTTHTGEIIGKRINNIVNLNENNNLKF